MAKYCKRCEGLKTPDTWDDNRLCEYCLLEVDATTKYRMEMDDEDQEDEGYYR